MGRTNLILCIKNIEIETLGSFGEYFLSEGYEIAELLANKKAIQSLNLKKYDAVFILGGPMSVNDNYDYLVEEKKLIQSTIEHEIPLLGICLGSQLIASACGGAVFKGQKKEIGWGKVEMTDCGSKSIFKNLSKRKMQVFHWHGDTFTLPVGAQVLAKSDLYVQAFSFKSAIGIQFHLEVNKEMVKNWSKVYQHELIRENLSIKSFLVGQDKKFLELKRISKQICDNFKI
ncbi:type 1 glutamine amidotransferase [Candidatus Nitrosocosmicus hydrocola]|uniref:type 1 glutamine amidotransferase n=1 Tax=Candidatus Nitrosocosmicus hydrocola TaxID=1826872 RepID=UPI000AEAEB54|nr:type 1 glutamine amidotransferase [Candidatus Nitrosocosmicus hydrocola]